MSVERKRGETIRSKERQVIRNVIKQCDREKDAKSLTIPINKATKRAALYCNVSVCTIKNIRKEGKDRPSETLGTPGKKRCAEKRTASVDNFDRRVILNIIHDFYVNKKTVPTCKKLLPILKERINFQWSEWTLRKIMKEMGFVWKRCMSKRKILIERPDIINWRCNYLQKLKKYREQGRCIFYLDETWVDANLTFHKCWQHQEVDGTMTTISASNRLIVAHLGSENGFLNNAELIFKAGNSTGDYHGQMNSTNFEKWVCEKVIPNLPANSVVILDNAPYHCRQEDKPPSQYSLKSDMLTWLRKQGIECDASMRKSDLHEKIEKVRPKNKIYAVDTLLQLNGHEVLRTPPYMCDLSAIELAWSKLKYFIRSHNTAGDFSLTRLQQILSEGLAAITPEDWSSYSRHVINIESEYWQKDGILEDAIDRIIVSVGGCDEDDTDLSSDGSDESVSDSDLARPLE